MYWACVRPETRPGFMPGLKLNCARTTGAAPKRPAMTSVTSTVRRVCFHMIRLASCIVRFPTRHQLGGSQANGHGQLNYILCRGKLGCKHKDGTRCNIAKSGSRGFGLGEMGVASGRRLRECWSED